MLVWLVLYSKKKYFKPCVLELLIIFLFFPQHAFGYAHENKLDVTCQCHFLAKYFENNKSKYNNLKVKLDLKD